MRGVQPGGSRPTRGAWIEMARRHFAFPYPVPVAPHTGRVD